MDKEDPTDSPTTDKNSSQGSPALRSSKQSTGETMDGSSSLGAFWQELRQRKVMRVGIAYGAIAWLMIEISATVFPYLGIPDSAVTALIILVIIGFPIALVLSWIYDLTPQGIRNTDTVREEQAEATGKKVATANHPALFLFIAALVPTLIFGVATLYFFLRAKSATDELIFITQTEMEELSEKSIAVLPFENLSSGEDDASFTNGLHDDLTTMLTGIAALTTIERNSTIPYRETTLPMQSVARALGVRILLTGTVQWSSRSIRVKVQLFDAILDENLWGHVFTKDLASFPDLLEIQVAISREIADQLEVHLTPEEEERIDNVPTESLESWEIFAKGREIVRLNRQGRRDEAIGLLKEAISIDPEFSLAHEWLARAHWTKR